MTVSVIKNFYSAFVYKVLKEIIWFYFFFRRIEKSLGKVETWPDPSLIISLICLREIRSNLSCSRILLAPAQFLLENYRESVTQKLKVQKFIFFTYQKTLQTVTHLIKWSKLKLPHFCMRWYYLFSPNLTIYANSIHNSNSTWLNLFCI